MRSVICCISILATTLMMSGCGQSGALQLTSDPNYDKRAKYLIYPDQPVTQDKKTTGVPATEATAASSATSDVAVQ